MIVQEWGEVVLGSLQDLWVSFVDFIPALIGALVVFVVGWIIALALGKFASRILQTLQVDKFLDQLGIMKALHGSGINWELSSLIGGLVKWFFIIAFFLAAVDILGLTGVADFLQSVLLYIPNIIVAALILLVAALVADFLNKIVQASMKATEMKSVRFVSLAVRWSVWGFAILAALDQLGIATTMVNTLFMGFVVMLALAGGLAFGLGGRDVAKDFLEDVRKDLKE